MDKSFIKIQVLLFLLVCSSMVNMAVGQAVGNTDEGKASRKIEKGYEKNDADTLAEGYFELGNSFYRKGELEKSESNYLKAKDLYEKNHDAEGIGKSSRALAKVQEDLHKTKQAITNYAVAQKATKETGDLKANALNTNDIGRLMKPDSIAVQEKLLLSNIDLGRKNKDSNEIAGSYSRMAQLNLDNNVKGKAVSYYTNAYQFSKNNPAQALRYNQAITDVYLQDKNFSKAIETKQQALKEPFVQGSTQIKANEIASLADIYIRKNEDSTAIRLLNESYVLSVKNGHTLEAKKCVEKLDSIFRGRGEKEKSLDLYKNFLAQLPGIIQKDNSLTDNKIIAETEDRIRLLETDKAFKDGLIRKKNILNYWLIALVLVLLGFTVLILFILRKLKIKNRKIALQSLRREMNPHFIFNSLNSINQYISNNNELEANRYLTRFSTLMRRVMENSKDDFLPFANEKELLQNYLELEKSRFPDKFDFSIAIDDALYADEQLYIPGMLIQPHLENAIWHGLRYIKEKGFLQLSFTKKANNIEIIIADNGIGITESKKNKTANQKEHKGRGISNTLERIRILNELYHQHITCTTEEKAVPERGVVVTLTVPLLKHAP